MILPLSVVLAAASLANALPFRYKRAVTSLPTTPVPVLGAGGSFNPEAAAEAHKRDETATRALTNVEIKTSNGNCLSVDPVAGDFRMNLIPIAIAPCDGTPNQRFDFITRGIHNNDVGHALIVSSLTQGCFNIDPRRRAGDQVNIFSCGGRAAGEGGTQGAQLFPFTGNNGPRTLSSKGESKLCFVPGNNGRLDNAPCNGAADQLFTIGGTASPVPAPVPTSSSSSSSPVSSAPVPASSSLSSPVISALPPSPTASTVAPPPAAGTVLASIPTTSVPVKGAGGRFNPTAAAEAHKRDETATRALTNVRIKTSTGQCLLIDPVAGDFRMNLIPIIATPCDGSPNQNFDFVTRGVHNDRQGAALIVSSLTQGCFNIDPRRRAGDQVNIFSCGGRAAGEGGTQVAQLFPVAGTNTGRRTLTTLGEPNRCFVVVNGRLDNAACNGSPEQLFTIEAGNSAAPVPAPSAAPSSSLQPTAVAPTLISASSSVAAPQPTAPPAGNIPSANPTTPVPVSRAGGVLRPSDAAQSHQRDNTATRARSSVSLRTADGRCLFIDPTSGDFRQNLIPIQLKECDGSPNEKFDIITNGVHNNNGRDIGALVVSTLTQGCLNFDSRRAAGDQAILFSCGGRADGEGGTTDSQLFPFTAAGNAITLAPLNARGATCLTANGGILDAANCSGLANQAFTIVA